MSYHTACKQVILQIYVTYLGTKANKYKGENFSFINYTRHILKIIFLVMK